MNLRTANTRRKRREAGEQLDAYYLRILRNDPEMTREIARIFGPDEEELEQILNFNDPVWTDLVTRTVAAQTKDGKQNGN